MRHPLRGLCALFTIAIAPIALAQTTQPAGDDMSATRRALDQGWLFRPDPMDAGLEQSWHAAALDDNWKPIKAPGEWESQGHKGYDGVGWYHIEFTPPPAVNGKQRAIAFFGVDDEATVWLNGVEVAREKRYNRRFAFFIEPQVKPGPNVLRVRVVDRGHQGGITRPIYVGVCEKLDELMQGEYASKPARASADFVRDAVIYCAYLRSASPEGTFKGFEKRLDEIHDLGATVIWLLPIHPVGEKNRKGALGSPYASQEFYKTNPEFGSLDDFKSLLAATHERGMKLIIDLVINHTAWDNPLIAEHPEWYQRGKDGEIRMAADWSDVAQLDYSKPELRAWMEAMMLYWVRDVGIDGFRCDVAGMVPLDFWTRARAKLDDVKPVIMLAEDDNPAQHLANFDLTYDWGTYDALGVLRAGDLKAAAIADVFAAEGLDYPRGSLRLRFTCNHDKNAWVKPAAERLGPEGQKLGAVLSFLLPGVPLIYNGQEVGSPQVLPLFERVALDWSSDPQKMRPLYRELAKLRRENAALRLGAARVGAPVGEAQILVVEREFEGQRIGAMFNLGKAATDVDVAAGATPLLASAGAAARRSGWKLPPLGYVVLSMQSGIAPPDHEHDHD